MFRGVLARGLAGRMPLWAAAAISAAVFSAYHLSLVQALPTLTLGLALAAVAIRADSAAPAIVAHALNNAIAIAVSRDELPALAGWLDHHADDALWIAIAVAAAGLVLALVPVTPARPARLG